MKKFFVIFLALCGIGMVVKGFYNFFPLNFHSILDYNSAYSIGHCLGVVFGKIALKM